MNVKVNLNDYVYVELTPHGREMHKKHHMENFGKYGMEYAEPNVDKDGISVFHLWEFMNIFGSYMYNGCKMVCETNVEIKNS